jgi:integrase
MFNKSVPKYRKHRGSGQAVVTIAGRDHYLGPFNSKTSIYAYDRLVAEWLVSGRSLSFGKPEADLTVKELILDFWRFLKEEHRHKKHKGDLKSFGYALKPLRRLYGNDSAREFGPLQLKAVRLQFVELGWSRKYVNTQVKRVCRLFKWATGEGKLPAAIYDALRLVEPLKPGKTSAPECQPVLPIADDIVEKTIAKCNPIIADMIRLQRYCGCRPDEIVNLKRSDIQQTGEVWTVEVQEHKTSYRGKKRWLYFGPKSQAILAKYLNRKPEAFLFSPKEAEELRRAELSKNRKTPLSCGNRPGSNVKRSPKKVARNAYDVASYRRAIHYACDKAAIERWSPNRLRHSAATEVRSKFGLDAASALLGHSDLAITTTYAELDAQKAAAVAAAIG